MHLHHHGHARSGKGENKGLEGAELAAQEEVGGETLPAHHAHSLLPDPWVFTHSCVHHIDGWWRVVWLKLK